MAYILSLFVAEFLVKDGLLLVARPDSVVDLAVLQWLRNEIRSLHSIDDHAATIPSTIVKYRDPQRKMWVLAAACYALLLTSVSGHEPPVGRTATGSSLGEEDLVEDEVAEMKLLEMRVWWHRRITEWTGTKRLPWCSLSMEILGKVAWLTTLDGEPIIAQLYRDGISQIRNKQS